LEDLEDPEGERDRGIKHMAIKIEKTFQVQEPLESVWAFISDPRKVANCLPGAQITETVDDRTFKGVIKIQVGPSVTDYKGQVHIERIDKEQHEIEFVGKGQDVRGKGSASMKMTGSVRALPDGNTEVGSVAEVNVVGLLAQMGGRMIQEVSNQMFAQFTANFTARLQQERTASGDPAAAQAGAEDAKPIQAVPILLSAARDSVAGSIRRMFKGSNEP
jgi:carbon monoxide dehydrogenase subunit G